jgi:glycosyl hydrolase family 43
MVEVSRRTLLGAAVVGGAGALAVGGTAVASRTPRLAARWVGAGVVEHVYDPSPPGGPKRYLNDHCTIQAPDGTWHLYSIIGDSAPPGGFPDGGLEDSIAHATAPDPRGPWTTQPPALTVDPGYFGEDHLWAPHVVEQDGTYYMFYAAGGDGAAINLATSTDLVTWTRIPSGPLFRGTAARDTFLVRIGEQWVMYYCEIDGANRHVVAARTSTDLLGWSEPRTVFLDPTTASTPSVTESPFLVERDGWWYLFIGPRNGYTGTDVFASQDPFAFSLDGYAGHLPVHAAEVVRLGEEWLVTAAGSFGDGLYVAPLEWRDTPPLWHSPANPAVALGGTGELTLFALAADRSTVVSRGLSGDWTEFGTGFATVPTTATQADGRLIVFAVRPGGGLAARSQQADGSWAQWQDFGGPVDAAPAAALDAADRLHLFALGPAGRSVLHRAQLAANGTEWSAWETFGGPAGAPPVVAANADGRLEVFALGPGGAYIAHRWQNTPGGDWHDWYPAFGTAAGAAPVIARDGRGLLNVVALAPVGAGLHSRAQSAPSNGWAAWQQWGPWADTAPTVVANADGRLEGFFVPPAGGIVYHRYQRGDGSWSAYEEFGPGPVGAAPAAGVAADGRIHVFAVTPDGAVRIRVQTEPSGGWGEWQELPGAAIAVVPVSSAT